MTERVSHLKKAWPFLTVTVTNRKAPITQSNFKRRFFGMTRFLNQNEA